MKKLALTSLFALMHLLGTHSLAQANPAPEIDFINPSADQLRTLEPEILEALTKWLTARNEELNIVLKNLVELKGFEEHLDWEDDLVADIPNETEVLFRRIQLKTYVLSGLLEGSDEP